MRHLRKLIVILLLAPCAVLAGAAPEYTPDNRLAVPADYRQWVFLTSSIDLNYASADGPASGQPHLLDNVFVNPEAYQAFLKNGEWPDGTVLVKENRIAESAGTLSRSGRFQTAIRSIEIHVKDAARSPGKWGFYVSADGKAPGAPMPAGASCYSCHQDHGAADTTFVQFYPTLLGIAQAKGTLDASYLKDSAAK
jgi:Cytochrome P460